MEDAGTGAGHRAPPSVLRRLALGQRVAARAVSHTRVADAVLRRRAPELLSDVDAHRAAEGGSRTRRAWAAEPAAPMSAAPDAVRWVPAPQAPSGSAPPVFAPPAPAPQPPLSEEAATFRSLMKQRYRRHVRRGAGSTPV